MLNVVTSNRILLVTDNIDSAKAYAALLTLQGIEVSVGRPEQIDQMCEGTLYHLALIDINNRAIDALKVCRQIHCCGPILLMTYEHDERYLLEAYHLGVDECIVKPIGLDLFSAKIQAWLRRVARPENTASVLTHKGFRLHLEQRKVITPDGSIVKLSRLEFELIRLFLNNVGRILEIQWILDRVWANTDETDHDLVKNLVYRLRRKIEPDPFNPRYLQTITGYGYVFMPE
jgi:two-component system KDP operon response regulator KdpE